MTVSVLAIDQGTTSTKAFVLSQNGAFRPVGSVVHRQILPGPGLVEHDANELIAAIEALIEAGLADTPDIAAIALANQGETVVAWDKVTGKPLHNAIVWQDQRTQPQLDQFSPTDRRLILDRAGLPADAYFSAAKLGWLLQNVPEVADAARQGRLRLGTSDAFFLHRLTGTCATDATTASRTSLMNLTAIEWDADLCALFGVPVDVLPPIRASTGGFGRVTRRGRAIPILASLVDQQAALYGHGCRHPGDAKITFGTGSFALAVTGAAPLRQDGLVPTVAWQRQGCAPVYALDAGDYTAAAAVDWCMAVGLGQSLQDFRFADATPVISRGLAFVPALAGLAAPWWRRDVAAAFIGLTQTTTATDMRKAVLEGVALRGADLVDLICAPGAAPVSVDGGLAKNGYFVQFLANVLGRPVRLPHSADLTGYGAALLAFDALGLTVAEQPGDPEPLILPDKTAGSLQAGRAYFRAAIQSLLALSAQCPV